MFLISKSINYVKANIIGILNIFKQHDIKNFDNWVLIFSLILCPISIIIGIVSLIIFITSGKFTSLNMNQEIYAIYFNNGLKTFFLAITIITLLLNIILYFKNGKKSSIILFIALIIGSILSFCLAIYFVIVQKHDLKMICIFASIILLLISIFVIHKSKIVQIKYAFFGILWIYIVIPALLYFITNVNSIFIVLVLFIVFSIGKFLLSGEYIETKDQKIKRKSEELQKTAKELMDIIKND